jgi:hypothetical protein
MDLECVKHADNWSADAPRATRAEENPANWIRVTELPHAQFAPWSRYPSIYRNEARHFTAAFARCAPRKSYATSAEKANDNLQSTFVANVSQWKTDTKHLSSIDRMVLHSSYLRIIGLGKPAIPFLIGELQKHPDYWFAALEAITGDDPVPENANFDQAVSAWVEWWSQQQSLESISPDHPTQLFVRKVSIGGDSFSLVSPLRIDVSFEEGLWYFQADALSIISYGQAKNDALRSFRSDFSALWRAIVQSPDDDLTPSALAVKSAFQRIVESFSLAETRNVKG